MMCASKVSRSTIAAHSRGSVNADVHSLNAALDATAMEAFSSRSVNTWNSSSAPRRLDVAQLVQAQKVDPPVPADHLGQGPVIRCLDQLVDQRRGGDVPDPVAVLGGGGAQPDQQVALAGPGVPDQAQRLPGGHPLA